MGSALMLFGQAGFPWFVHEFLPKYGPSVAVFEILALEIPLIECVRGLRVEE